MLDTILAMNRLLMFADEQARKRPGLESLSDEQLQRELRREVERIVKAQ